MKTGGIFNGGEYSGRGRIHRERKNEDPAGTVILSGNDSGDTAPDSNEGEEIKKESIIIEGITWELDKEKATSMSLQVMLGSLQSTAGAVLSIRRSSRKWT